MLITVYNVEYYSVSNKDKVYRKVMGKPLLVWSDLAEREAQQWANTLATTRAFEHSKKQGKSIVESI